MINKLTMSLIFISCCFLFAKAHANEEIVFWTTEIEPNRLKKQKTLADRFESKTGIKVSVVAITEEDLNDRTLIALDKNQLPDVIYHTLQYVHPWAESGILDIDANKAVVEALGENTFSPGPLSMAKYRNNIASVPIDSWTQLLIYRKDLFDHYGLKAPTSYQKVTAAIKKLHNPPSLFGFIAPTIVNDIFMSQIVEHILMANGISPVDESGWKKINKQKAIEAFKFYKLLFNASPKGELSWLEARQQYLSGKTAMILWSPFILDELAGLSDANYPSINNDPTSKELSHKSAIVTNFSGPSHPKGATWAEIRYLGITTNATTKPAQEFVKFSLSSGYRQTLSMAPEGMFPVRKGTATAPKKYINAWASLPIGVDRKAILSDIYSKEIIQELIQGLDTAKRWGVTEGKLALASKLINSRVLNNILKEYLNDKLSAEQAVDKLNDALSKLGNTQS